jgi:hypothetical protein
MSDMIRIIAMGALPSLNLELRIVPAGASVFHAGQAIAEVLHAAIAHGAVLYDVDVNADPDADYHDEDDRFEFFGGTMSYKEYWELYPEERLERPEPNWQPRILLRVGAPVLRLHTPVGDHLVYADAGHTLGTLAPDMPAAFVVGLMPADSPYVHDEEYSARPVPPIIQPGAIGPYRDSAVGVAQPQVWEWQLAADTTLHVSPSYPPASQRDWAWAWSRSLGPVYFNLHVSQTADELRDWLAGVRCVAYEQIGDALVRGEQPVRFSDVYQQVHLNAYHLSADQHSSGIVQHNDRLIMLIRSYHTPSPLQQAIDASLLASLRAGDLGELSWDLLDGDYVNFQATGASLESLRQYLDPNQGEQQQRDRWGVALARHAVDAMAAERWEQVAAAIALHFRVPSAHGDAEVDLEAWFAHTPIAGLPRMIEVSLKHALYDAAQEPRDRLQRASMRVLWSWRLGF